VSASDLAWDCSKGLRGVICRLAARGVCPAKINRKKGDGRPSLNRAGLSKNPDMAEPAGTSNGEVERASIRVLPPQSLRRPPARKGKTKVGAANKPGTTPRIEIAPGVVCQARGMIFLWGIPDNEPSEITTNRICCKGHTPTRESNRSVPDIVSPARRARLHWPVSASP
jgi:hypothetical protein